MSRNAIVNKATLKVVNIVELGLMPPAPLDPVTNQPRYKEEPPEGHVFVPSETLEIGDVVEST